MELLILGYSAIAERRVIPAAGRVAGISGVSIASRSRSGPADWPKRKKFFSDYAKALATSDAEIVYLSLPNSLHEQWVWAALRAGKHVIVDKPALLSAEASARAVAEARRCKLLLVEATVFICHPHFDALINFVKEHAPLTHVTAQFIIPPLPIKNFRNHAELGGGCLFDMGPYAAAIVREFGDGSAKEIFAVSSGRHPETGVDIGFSIITQLRNGATFTGQFSFEGEYQNRLMVVARSGSVSVERVFSLPADLPVVWQQRVNNVESIVKFNPADTFAEFLNRTVQAIKNGTFEAFYRDLLVDSEFRTRLTEAIKAKTGAAN